LIFKKFFSYLFKKTDTKTLFLIDILNMQDLNAIYNFDNGNYIIKQLNSILKIETKNSIEKILNHKSNIKIKNSHADIFEFFIYDDLSIEEIIKVKNLIYENIVSNDFKLLNKIFLINIDVTIGCSKSADDRTKVYTEKALHNAKQDFLHYSYYDSFLYKNELINEDLVETINYSIENNLVEPYFQAIMNNETNEIVKYEALMRIFDKDGNMLMPNVFIHKAKKCRLYNKLMEILFDKIIIYILKYKIHVSINLDYIDILNPHIKKTLLKKIKDNKIGSYLTLEILESEKVSNFELVNKFINETKHYGVKIAIDDFGTGFSNYENILNLDINYIKIDGSLIRKIDETIYLNLIKSIVSFSKEQNIKVVAEFVSDLKILRYVKSLGIDYSQGYQIGKPMHINDIIKGNK
jgi:EAL domain-containing protein (putative c-di-GMP-specific phosphodiesterase class I)/GGDEF domain-containing protein